MYRITRTIALGEPNSHFSPPRNGTPHGCNQTPILAIPRVRGYLGVAVSPARPPSESVAAGCRRQWQATARVYWPGPVGLYFGVSVQQGHGGRAGVPWGEKRFRTSQTKKCPGGPSSRSCQFRLCSDRRVGVLPTLARSVAYAYVDPMRRRDPIGRIGPMGRIRVTGRFGFGMPVLVCQ